MCNSNQLNVIENDELIQIRSAKTFDELYALIKRQPNHNNKYRNKHHQNYNYCSVDKYRASSYNGKSIIIDNNANRKIKPQCSHCHVHPLKSNYNNNKVTTNSNRYPNDTGTVDTFKTKCKCNCHRSNAIDEHINKRNDDSNGISYKCNDWYIELASNCYRNGFQSHLNYLDSCSKYQQRIPIQQTEQLKQSLILRTALKQTSDSLTAEIKTTKAAATHLHSPSAAALLHRSSEPLSQSAHRLNDEYCVASCGANIQVCERHQNRLINRYRQPITIIANNTINNRNSLQPIWRQRQSIENPIQRIYETINAKNTMSSVAIDADEIQANQFQLLLLSHRGALSKADFPIDQQQNHQLNRIQRDRLAINNKSNNTSTRANSNNINNNYYHSTDDNNQIPLLPLINDDKEAGTSMNDLIHAFNNSLNVYDTCECSTDNYILPQIILSDFSSDQKTTPITSLTLFAKQQSIHLPQNVALKPLPN